MKPIIQYQIEVAICMAAFTLFYLIFWRKETNFLLKRIILLGIPLFSIIIPLISFNIDFGPKPESNTIQYITYIPNQLEMVYAPFIAEAETLSGWEIAFWVMCMGIGIMVLRLLISYLKIIQIYGRSVVDSSGEFKIIDDPIQSFSFFNMIVINKSQARSGACDYILAHEKAHKHQGHSWDILWFELIKMLHWFNPIIWLLTQESRKNLEYLADQEVANTTGNLKNYQFAIVEHATQTGFQLLKTQFSKNNLKNRIIMMNQPNNQRMVSWKLFSILPILAVLFMSFSLKIENLDINRELSEVLPSFNNLDTIDKKIKEKTNSDMSSRLNTFSKTINKVDSNESQNSIHLKPFDSDSFLEDKSQKTTLNNSKLSNSQNYIIAEKPFKLSLATALRDNKNNNEVLKNESTTNDPNDNSFPFTPNDSISKEIFLIVEDQPYPSTGDMTSYYEQINKSLIYPKEAKEKGVEGKVFVQFIVRSDGSLTDVKAVKGIGYGCDEEAVRVIKEGPKWIPGKQRGRAVNVRFIMPVAFGMEYPPKDLIGDRKISGVVKTESGELIRGANILIKGFTIGTITDVNGKFLLQFKPEHKQIVVSKVGYEIRTLDIIDGKDYEITLKEDQSGPVLNSNNSDEFKVIGKVKDESGNPIAGCNVIIKGTTTGTVTDMDGNFQIKFSPEKNNTELVLASQGYQTQTITAKKESTLFVVLKKTEPLKIRGMNVFDASEKPLFIIDGVEMEDFDERNLDPKDIESISVLKDKAALEKYGEKGRNGVLKIQTRSNVEKMKDLAQNLDQLPEYKNGMNAFYQAIQENIKYPLDARKHNVQGEVFVSFTISKEGNLEDIKTEEAEFLALKEIVVVGYSKSEEEPSRLKNIPVLAEEVIRVLKQIDNFKPGIHDGQPVEVRMTLPVTFKLQ